MQLKERCCNSCDLCRLSSYVYGIVERSFVTKLKGKKGRQCILPMDRVSAHRSGALAGRAAGRYSCSGVPVGEPVGGSLRDTGAVCAAAGTVVVAADGLVAGSW